METAEILFKMNDGDSTIINTNPVNGNDNERGPVIKWIVTKVPTGWIFSPFIGKADTIFVPLTTYTNPII